MNDKLVVFIYRAIMVETMMVNQDNGHVNAVGLMLYYYVGGPISSGGARSASGGDDDVDNSRQTEKRSE